MKQGVQMEGRAPRGGGHIYNVDTFHKIPQNSFEYCSCYRERMQDCGKCPRQVAQVVTSGMFRTSSQAVPCQGRTELPGLSYIDWTTEVKNEGCKENCEKLTVI